MKRIPDKDLRIIQFFRFSFFFQNERWAFSFYPESSSGVFFEKRLKK
jgi:hypothetical protein